MLSNSRYPLARTRIIQITFEKPFDVLAQIRIVPFSGSLPSFSAFFFRPGEREMPRMHRIEEGRSVIITDEDDSDLRHPS